MVRLWYYEMVWIVLRDGMADIKRWYGCGIKRWYGCVIMRWYG